MYNKVEDKWQCTNKAQEAGKPEKCNSYATGIPNQNSKDGPAVIDNNNNKVNYIFPGPPQEDDKRASAKVTQKLHKEFSDVFTGIGCLMAHSHCKQSQKVKPYQVSPRHVAV